MLHTEPCMTMTEDDQKRRRARRLAIKLGVFAFIVYVGYIVAFIARRS